MQGESGYTYQMSPFKPEGQPFPGNILGMSPARKDRENWMQHVGFPDGF